MGEDFFKCLPPEIEVNILSRLPTRAATVCKCVCKSWLVLLATPEFVNSHMSRSVPGLAVETDPKSYEVFEFVNELGFNFGEEYQRDAPFNFELPFDEPIQSSRQLKRRRSQHPPSPPHFPPEGVIKLRDESC
ncbi:F-box protein CPR1-like [Salvia divinorum]|uniref:F-box protein CPR1-like n=1 Tax=Salvia divinorum TaxID=28513 RepID=A0ABD1HN63_SALDI